MRKSKWRLTLPLAEARRNDEVISIGDSQVLRWIDELNGVKDADSRAKSIKKRIKSIKKQPNSLQNRREIKRLYAELDSVQFKPDYMCLIIDRVKDYKRACQGFSINGVEYSRLLGTNGGVKNETIVFVSKRLVDELRKRIENGRDPNKRLIPAKYEAYRALACSGSTPVSMPNGILVVNDCETSFYEEIIGLSDELPGDPQMVVKPNEEILLNESDGYGLMLPSLAERWSNELGLDYVVSGVNTRFSFEKGMVFTFDFIDFADRVAHNRIVKDAWGNDADISNIELVLTTSMLKLWDCYDSLDHYLQCCEENKYTFNVAKTCPKELERERDLNYQFIQSYNLSDEEIDKLIQPTIDYIKDVISGDYRQAILFLKGMYLNEDNIDTIADDFAKAIMIDKRVYDDPFIKRKIFQMIKKRINDAKIGVIRVHGNYSIVSGDPYSLCQHIFGLPVTGLLKSGEIYNNFWVNECVEKVVCFRAPMTCHNNIRLMRVASNDDILYWYRYMNTCTVFNSFDSSAAALNGMDKDGDLVLTTNNDVLISNYRQLPTIMCIQRKAEKVDITEENLIQSNINSFGDDIGKTTNWITSMFEVQSEFEPGSPEYETLDYRIKCGQLYQQNAIDKAKGIISNPMPRAWYDRSANRITEELSEAEVSSREFNLRILADKKPYFMIYIYPALMKQYNTYIKNTSKKCMREFRKTTEELLSAPTEQLSNAESEFIKYYIKRMPVGIRPCTMNRICKRIEEEFDGYFSKNIPDEAYDYSIMSSGRDYTAWQYTSIAKLYDQYTKRVQEYARFSKIARIDEDESAVTRSMFIQDLISKSSEICSDARQVCDIVLDICYSHGGSKQFCWDICGREIVENLLDRNNNTIVFPVMCDDGDIVFDGVRFKMIAKGESNGQYCA